MTQKAGTVLDRYMYLIVNSKVTLLKFLVLQFPVRSQFSNCNILWARPTEYPTARYHPALSKNPAGARSQKVARSRNNISNLVITKLFFHIFLIRKRVSQRTRSLRRKHFSAFRYRLTKIGFAAPKRSRGKRGPGSTVPVIRVNYDRIFKSTRYNTIYLDTCCLFIRQPHCPIQQPSLVWPVNSETNLKVKSPNVNSSSASSP